MKIRIFAAVSVAAITLCIYAGMNAYQLTFHPGDCLVYQESGKIYGRVLYASRKSIWVEFPMQPDNLYVIPSTDFKFVALVDCHPEQGK